MGEKPERFTLRCTKELFHQLQKHKRNLGVILASHEETSAVEVMLEKIQHKARKQLKQLKREHADMLDELCDTKRELECAQSKLTQLGQTDTGEYAAARKASFLTPLLPKTLKKRTAQSDTILKTTFENVTTLHGKDTLPFVLAAYMEAHLNDAFLLLLVQHYRGGWLYQHWQQKLATNIHQAIGPAVATELIDSANGVNFTGFRSVMEALRPVLPEGSLPSKHDIKWVRDMWGNEMARTLDLQPTGAGTVGWDVDPFKFLRFLLTHIYPILLSDICAVKNAKIVMIEHRCRAHFLDTDPHLNIGDRIIIKSNIHTIRWIVRPQSIGAHRVYLFEPPVAPSVSEYLIDCQFQRAIYLVRSDDGRRVLNDGQVLESWRFINEQLTSHTQSVNDVWFSCLIDGAEDKENMQKGRIRQYNGLKKMREDGCIDIDGTKYPLYILGPADLKNQKTMFQRGGNPCTTTDFCTHCGRTKILRSLCPTTVDDIGKFKMIGPCYRVGSGSTPASISELGISTICCV